MKSIKLTVKLSGNQAARLSKAAAQLGNRVSAQELAIAGAMDILDFSGDTKANAFAAIRNSVRTHARRRKSAGLGINTAPESAPEASPFKDKRLKLGAALSGERILELLAIHERHSGAPARVHHLKGIRALPLFDGRGEARVYIATGGGEVREVYTN